MGLSKKMIAGMLTTCFIVQSTIPSMQISAKGKDKCKENTLERAFEIAMANTLTMEEAEDGIHSIGEKDEDGDGLSNFWEDEIGTDKENPDTDGDGLTDYEEVVLTGTDPLLVDTDGNGVLDGDEDIDGDGLTNKQEIELGTDPLCLDSDEDGLNDWEEVMEYKTNPTSYDTDADGASDGFEVEMVQKKKKGFDPLSKNKKMNQRLREETQRKKLSPYAREIEDEFVGSIQLVGSHSADAAFTEGHSFLVYTSYVDGQSIKIDDLYGAHRFNEAEYAEAVAENENLLSWRSLFTECTPENEEERKTIANAMWPYDTTKAVSYSLNRGDYLSIGNFTQNSYIESIKDGILNAEKGTLAELVALQVIYEKITGKKVSIFFIISHLDEITKLLAYESYIKDQDIINGKTDGGIWLNREMYDQRYIYDQFPHEIYKVEITQAEYDHMIDALNNHNYYSMLNHNCSSVAAIVWNAAVGYETDDNGNYMTDKKGRRIASELNVSARGKGALSIMDFPGAICESILELKEKEPKRGCYYSENSQIVKGEPLHQ